jgi:5-methylcytosine-specific restriction protein A
VAALHNRHWREWYNDAQYRARRKHQLQKQPMCEECLAQGRTTPATVADHVEPHGGDVRKFRTGRLRSSCKPCHDRKWADDRRGYSTAIGADGYPVDQNHPAYRGEMIFSDAKCRRSARKKPMISIISSVRGQGGIDEKRIPKNRRAAAAALC